MTRKKPYVKQRHRRGWDGPKQLSAALLESAVREIKTRVGHIERKGLTPEQRRLNLANIYIDWQFATSESIYHQLLDIDPDHIEERLRRFVTPEQYQQIRDAYSDRVAISNAMDKRDPQRKRRRAERPSGGGKNMSAPSPETARRIEQAAQELLDYAREQGGTLEMALRHLCDFDDRYVGEQGQEILNRAQDIDWGPK